MRAIIAACTYHIWRNRNEVLWTQKVWTIAHTVQSIQQDVKNRLSVVLPKKLVYKDRCWYEKICKQGRE